MKDFSIIYMYSLCSQNSDNTEDGAPSIGKAGYLFTLSLKQEPLPFTTASMSSILSDQSQPFI